MGKLSINISHLNEDQKSLLPKAIVSKYGGGRNTTSILDVLLILTRKSILVYSDFGITAAATTTDWQFKGSQTY